MEKHLGGELILGVPTDTQNGFFAAGAALRAFTFSGNFAGNTLWPTVLT
jgi:hypothetical protein